MFSCNSSFCWWLTTWNIVLLDDVPYLQHLCILLSWHFTVSLLDEAHWTDDFNELCISDITIWAIVDFKFISNLVKISQEFLDEQLLWVFWNACSTMVLCFITFQLLLHSVLTSHFSYLWLLIQILSNRIGSFLWHSPASTYLRYNLWQISVSRQCPFMKWCLIIT